jgi:hypothetical protein
LEFFQALGGSMAEQAMSGEEHGYATSVCGVNDFLITD